MRGKVHKYIVEGTAQPSDNYQKNHQNAVIYDKSEISRTSGIYSQNTVIDYSAHYSGLNQIHQHLADH